MRPQASYDPAIELMEEPSDVSALVVLAQPRKTGLISWINSGVVTGARRHVSRRIWSLKCRIDFCRGEAYSAPAFWPLLILLSGSRIGRLPRLILKPRNSKPYRTCTICVLCALMFTPSVFRTLLAVANAARACAADEQVTTQSSEYLVS